APQVAHRSPYSSPRAADESVANFIRMLSARLETRNQQAERKRTPGIGRHRPGPGIDENKSLDVTSAESGSDDAQSNRSDSPEHDNGLGVGIRNLPERKIGSIPKAQIFRLGIPLPF